MNTATDSGTWSSNHIPQSWEWTTFREVWEDATNSKKKLKQKEYLEEGPLAVVDQGESFIGGYTDNLTLKSEAQLPCVIFGDHSRAVKYIDFPFAQGADGVKVLVPTPAFDPEFAYLSLRCLDLPDKGYSRHFKFLKASSFPIPPLAEQRRIVSRLDQLSARSSKAKNHLADVQTLATRAKQATLAAAFRGEWRMKPLSALASVGTGATPKKGTPRFYKGGSIPWVTSGVANQDLVTEAEQYITEAAISETNCKIYPAGTILVAMYGEGKTRGMVTRLGIDAATNQALAAIQITSLDHVHQEWVPWLLQSKYLEMREMAAGGVQPNLNLGIIKAIDVPLPSLKEQSEIVGHIEAAFARIDRMVAEATRAAELLVRLEAQLLAKAFRGELVAQDPADEPASALLARIRDARANAAKPKRRKTKSANV